MRARYTGSVVTTFEAPVGVVHHGDEFDLPKGRERAFLQHGHIEPADKPAKDFVAKNRKTTRIDIREIEITDESEKLD
jgi:hypothetical protein